MRFAVISDIHGNLSALEATLAAIDAVRPQVESVVCAGDVVGVGRQPNEVVELLRSRNIDSVRGNYDEAIVLGRSESGRDFASADAEAADADALERTRRLLTQENLAYLTGLPRDLTLSPAVGGVQVKADAGDERTNEYRKTFIMRALFGGLARQPVSTTRRIRVMHGSPRALNEIIRGDTANSILQAIARDAQADLLITGHAGVPFRRDVHEMTFIGVGQVSPSFDGPGVAEFAVIQVGQGIDVDFGRAEYGSMAQSSWRP